MEFKVENEDVALHGQVQGPEDAPAVLLVHGACVDGSFFDAAATELARNFRVAVYDRRGYGRSPLPDRDADCSVAVQANDAAAVIEQVLGSPAHVVAHSGGCAVGMELAVQRPDLVARLVLDEPLFYDCCRTCEEFMQVSARIRQALARGNESLALHLFMPTIGTADPRSQAPKTPLDLARDNCNHFIHSEYLALSRFTPSYEALCRADAHILSSEEIPHGEQYPACAHELARRIGAPLIVALGAHNFPADRPQEFAALVAEALRPQNDRSA